MEKVRKKIKLILKKVNFQTFGKEKKAQKIPKKGRKSQKKR